MHTLRYSDNPRPQVKGYYSQDYDGYNEAIIKIIDDWANLYEDGLMLKLGIEYNVPFDDSDYSTSITIDHSEAANFILSDVDQKIIEFENNLDIISEKLDF